MPRQGNTVESCIITDWKVKEGDTVTSETEICEVETDKASFQVPAGAGGTVLKLLHEAGDDVPVLKPIAIIGAAGEDWKSTLLQETPLRGTEVQKEDESPSSSSHSSFPIPDSSFHVPNSSASPRARNMAAKEALPLEKITGTGPGGRITERDVEAALKNRPVLTAAAKAAGPETIPQTGSGIGARVTIADLAAVPDFLFPIPHSSLSDNHSSFTDTPIKGIRKIIADRMFKSLTESAQFTLNASAPASGLLEFRSKAKTQKGPAEKSGLLEVTINDLVLFALVKTLPYFPYMNAHKTDDKITVYKDIHLAIAVDTPRGLMVPVIRNADRLSLVQISAEAKRLAAACQNGSANPDELGGSTFTVSNLGSLGVTSFTPILNTPEVAILGVCSIELKPVAQLSDPYPITFEPHIGLSLTINHQAVDGAPAARFLKALCDSIARIDQLINIEESSYV